MRRRRATSGRVKGNSVTTRASKAETTPLQEAAAAEGLEPISGDVIPFGVAGLPSAADYGHEYRVADLIPTPAKWAEYAETPIDDIVNQDVIIRDVMYFDSQIEGQDEWAIVLFTVPATGEQRTTVTGSNILLRKLHKLQAFPIGDEKRNMLPIPGRFTKTPSQTKGHSPYYDLI